MKDGVIEEGEYDNSEECKEFRERVKVGQKAVGQFRRGFFSFGLLFFSPRKPNPSRQTAWFQNAFDCGGKSESY